MIWADKFPVILIYANFCYRTTTNNKYFVGERDMPERRNRSDIVFAKNYLPPTDWYNSSEVYEDLVTLFENANQKLLCKDFDLIE